MRIELDLVISKPGAEAELDLLYEPADVTAVLEVKASGKIGRGALDNVRHTFAAIRAAHPIFDARMSLSRSEKSTRTKRLTKT